MICSLITAIVHPVLWAKHMRSKWYWHRLGKRLDASQARMNKKWPSMWDEA